MMSGLMGSVVQGMAMGTGSAIAHRAVGAAFGSMGGGSEKQEAPQAAPVRPRAEPFSSTAKKIPLAGPGRPPACAHPAA
ncbi:hypothetical protein M885DRAFT_532737 [Pelagophyceae sp. CCMP2097]|nr:hypothetical protein M885DRAFT_532737 [Pelagophyceae sp. CCMP2097]